MLLSIPRAETRILPGNMVRLTIPTPVVNPITRWLWKSWQPGQHIRITIPAIGVLQPHPFTIASIPEDGVIQLFIRAHHGFTERLYEKASASVISGRQPLINVHIEGIYGAKFPSFALYDVVLLIASGAGATFTIPILKDLIRKSKDLQASDRHYRCKKIGFVWVVKTKGPAPKILIPGELSWFASELSEIMEQAYGLVAMRLYVTRDEEPTTLPAFPQDTGPFSPATIISEKGGAVVIPRNLDTFVRVKRPNLAGLVEQAADEAFGMGRLGIAACGSQSLVVDIKNSAARNLRTDMPDIFCHAEEFDY
jgi:FAD-binding domain/Ferric reductase NAD binding domain